MGKKAKRRWATLFQRVVAVEESMWRETGHLKVRVMELEDALGEAQPPASPSPGPTPMVPWMFWTCTSCGPWWDEMVDSQKLWGSLEQLEEWQSRCRRLHQPPQPASD